MADNNYFNRFPHLIFLLQTQSMENLEKEKMNWKNFFKPNKVKLIIFAVLEIPLLVFYYINGYNVMIRCSSFPCPFAEEFSTRWLNPLLYLVIPLSIIFYLISCITSFAVNKFREKKK